MIFVIGMNNCFRSFGTNGMAMEPHGEAGLVFAEMGRLTNILHQRFVTTRKNISWYRHLR